MSNRVLNYILTVEVTTRVKDDEADTTGHEVGCYS